MNASERRQAHAAATGVHPDSTYAYNALLDELGYPDALCKLCRAVGRMRDRDSARHQAWLRGGVHPLGTRARTLADARRRSVADRRIDAAYNQLGV